MPVFPLNDKPDFPPPIFADASGLLCEGGKLEYDWVKKALSNGFFVYTHPLRYPKWWTPDPRTVIQLDQWEDNVEKDEKHVVINKNVEEVLTFFQKNLNKQPMNYDWLTGIYKNVLLEFDKKKESMCIAVYDDKNELQGGIFGIVIGKAYFGEYAYFSNNNAMEKGVNHLLLELKNQNFKLVDLTKPTNFMEHEMMDQIPRDIYLSILKSSI